MKNLLLVLSALVIILNCQADRYITRGPNPGELYFLGPHSSGQGLYYSTDFGMTAILVDPTVAEIYAISAGKTSGVIYYVSMKSLYISTDFGYDGTWQYRNGPVYHQLNAGLMEGWIFSSFSSHSEDFGHNFINHNTTGFYGNKIDVEIDNDLSSGYVIINTSSVIDSLYLLFSGDTFSNLNKRFTFDMAQAHIVRIRRGFIAGEVFLLNRNQSRMLFSNDYGESWLTISSFNPVWTITGITGGRQDGELYVMKQHITGGYTVGHAYIFYSDNYGITFDVHHPVSIGPEPLVCNFTAKPEGEIVPEDLFEEYDTHYYPKGEIPLTIEFHSFSVGEIDTYKWDFNNDGTVDSYEESPDFIYSDTGWHSVRLTVFAGSDSATFLRENYVYSYSTVGIDEREVVAMSCFPNPFRKEITIQLANKETPHSIKIFDNRGKLVRTLPGNRQVTWNGNDENGRQLENGIYIIKCGSCINKVLKYK